MTKQTILVVDDYEGLSRVYRAALQQRGYRVEVAGSGAEGVQKAREIQPALVIMDVNLPDMDGLTAAFLLRSAPDTREIPIVAISGQSEHELRAEAIQLGCINFLQKPFALADLVREAERILALVSAA